MVKTWVWIGIVAALAVVCVVLSVCLWVLPREGGTVANVYVDGARVYSVDLSTVTEPYQQVIETPYGTNTLAIERGRIRVIDADCRGDDCVQAGWLTRAGQPIVCLPHRLVVRIEGEDNRVVQ